MRCGVETRRERVGVMMHHEGWVKGEGGMRCGVETRDQKMLHLGQMGVDTVLFFLSSSST